MNDTKPTLTEALKKRWFLIALVVVSILGFFLGRYTTLGEHFPRHWSLITLTLIMFCVGLTANLRALVESVLNWKASLLSLVMTYVIAPAVAFGLGWALFGKDSELFQGCVLVGCTASTVSSAIVYTRICGGNHALSIVLANLSNLVSVFLTPAMIGAFLGTTIEVDVSEMIFKLVIGVLIPILIAQIVSAFAGEKIEPVRPIASKLSQVGILVVVFTAVCRTFFNAEPAFYEQLPKVALQMMVFCFLIYFVLIRLSVGGARMAGLNMEDSIAVGFASSQKTLAATVVIATEFFTPMASLPMILYHLVQLLYGGYDCDRLKKGVMSKE
ncbi:MAG: bile acid:sodium symporter family protein [Planctomycetota bacterium]|nr:bile acid:sodium symporter family protein [Planctomycetota bacterium]